VIFNEILEIGLCHHRKNTCHREAVRAVVLKNKLLLMIRTNLGDYKFPGGGVEEGE